MKPILYAAVISGLLVPSAFGQGAQADQIKRRAKELSNQNNVRQGVPPPTPAPPSAAPARPAATAPVTAKPAAANPVTAQQQNIARLKADFAAFKVGTQVTSEQKQQLVRDLLAAARGPNKPSTSAVGSFVNLLAAALVGKGIEAPEQSRLAQNLEAIVNGASLPPAQTDAIAADVQAILQVCGARRAEAVAAADSVKAIAASTRNAPR